MDSRERFEKCLNHEEPDRVPIDFWASKEVKAIMLKQEIADIQLKIKQEAIIHLQKLKREINTLTRRINTLNYKLKNQLPDQQLRLAELEEQYKRNQSFYSSMQAELTKAEIKELVETEDVDILDPALVPEFPVNRDKKKKAVMGILFSIVIGIGVALGIEFLDKSIKTVDDIKKYLKLEVLCTIPIIDFKDINDYQDSEKIKQIGQQLVTYDYSPTPIGEAYRSLRTI